MTARIWRGWAAADTAEEIAVHLREGVVARFAAAPGNVSACLLTRPSAGGVELLTLSVWESAADLPAGVPESHRLLVAGQTVASCWDVADPPAAVARAA